jgi:NAD(P)-dependent dehydrogenase (short-subunit alcohol dehydrogenase family)
VVVTGTSSGIGRETATAFGRRRAPVALAARNQEGLDRGRSSAREARRTRSGRDVAEWPQVQRLAQEAGDRLAATR